MKRYTTKSGSVYEVDESLKVVRRLKRGERHSGRPEGTSVWSERMASGGWVAYDQLDDHGIGNSLYFWWLPHDERDAVPSNCTYTNLVTSIEEV